MKIAQIAPIYEAVPPKLYGGTERIVHYITEELVAQGHDVTLFASGDSVTKARLVPVAEEALRLNKNSIDHMAHHIVLLQKVIDHIHEFDVLHFHIDYLHFPITNRILKPVLTTLHGRLDIPDLQPVYDTYPNQAVVSISNNQQQPLPQANWAGTVYHGLPRELHSMGNGDGGYVAFIGRISPEKRVDRAIAIATACNKKLKIAAKIDKADQEYFDKEIKHLFDNPLVEYIGEINEKEKTEFLGKAEALLFPIDWAEPFGLVMIEAMACGTPVIAFRHGSVPEVVDEGVSGFIVEDVHQAIEALNKIGILDRRQVRATFNKKYTAERMAKDYVQIYEKLIEENKLKPASLKIESINLDGSYDRSIDKALVV